MMGTIVMVGIAPTSWKMGYVRRTTRKIVVCFGPLRFSIHRFVR